MVHYNWLSRSENLLANRYPNLSLISQIQSLLDKKYKGGNELVKPKWLKKDFMISPGFIINRPGLIYWGLGGQHGSKNKGTMACKKNLLCTIFRQPWNGDQIVMSIAICGLASGSRKPCRLFVRIATVLHIWRAGQQWIALLRYAWRVIEEQWKILLLNMGNSV